MILVYILMYFDWYWHLAKYCISYIYFSLHLPSMILFWKYANPVQTLNSIKISLEIYGSSISVSKDILDFLELDLKTF